MSDPKVIEKLNRIIELLEKIEKNTQPTTIAISSTPINISAEYKPIDDRTPGAGSSGDWYPRYTIAEETP